MSESLKHQRQARACLCSKQAPVSWPQAVNPPGPNRMQKTFDSKRLQNNIADQQRSSVADLNEKIGKNRRCQGCKNQKGQTWPV